GPRATTESEADAAREDECLTTTEFSASLRERREVRTLELECGAAEQVQSRLGGGGTDGPCGRGCVSDVQAAATIWSKGAACRDAGRRWATSCAGMNATAARSRALPIHFRIWEPPL